MPKTMTLHAQNNECEKASRNTAVSSGRIPSPHAIVTVKFSDILCPAEDARSHKTSDSKGRGSSQLAGTEVRIILPPLPADRILFKCDSEWMWELHPATLRELQVKSKDRIFVCRHQLEMD